MVISRTGAGVRHRVGRREALRARHPGGRIQEHGYEMHVSMYVCMYVCMCILYLYLSLSLYIYRERER